MILVFCILFIFFVIITFVLASKGKKSYRRVNSKTTNDDSSFVDPLIYSHDSFGSHHNSHMDCCDSHESSHTDCCDSCDSSCCD